jgi:hypothetical protein
MIRNYTANGPVDAEQFLVNAQLPNGVGFANLRVTRGDLPPGAHALIGMDIITQGDLAISNVRGKTVLSFRMPSMVKVDFVEEIKRQNARNAPKFRPGPPRGKKRKP